MNDSREEKPEGVAARDMCELMGAEGELLLGRKVAKSARRKTDLGMHDAGYQWNVDLR
jgi:hypothetical protein